jgi:hypothetical protein
VPGTIWVFAMAAAFPWSLLALWALVRRMRGKRDAEPLEPGDRMWYLYLACWALAPLVFFTAARNIIWTYVLPALPAMALLAAAWLRRMEGTIKAENVASACLVATLATVAIFGAHLYSTGTVDIKSAKSLRAAWQANRAAGEPLVFIGQMHSAAFYSNGQIQFAGTVQEARHMLGLRDGFIAISADRAGGMAREPGIRVLGQYGGRDLLHVSPTVQGDAR